MNITDEKEHIKEAIDLIDDESIILAVKNILDFAVKKGNFFKPLSIDELKIKALASEKDIQEGKLTDLEELETESENW